MVLWRLRILLFYALISVVTIVMFSSFYLPIKLFNWSYNSKYKLAVVFSYAYIYLCKSICGLRYEISGVEKLPAGPCIVISNHQSFWDNLIMQLIIPPHSWVIKKELVDIPVFGWGIKLFDPIAIDRTSNGSVHTILREGAKKLKDGLWLIIFPEAGTLKPEQEGKFKPSPAKLASMCKVPIVMMAHNSGVCWPKGFWIKRPGLIEIKIIDVISTQEIEQYDVRIITERAEEVINREKRILFEKATVTF